MTKKLTMTRMCPQCGEDYGAGVEFCPEDGTRLRDLAIADQEEDKLIGKDIDGRFQVDSILGEGGMGKVYRGKQLSVHRDVAIKVLRKELAGDQTLVKRFFREAQVISQFSHPNIVSLVDFGQDLELDVLYLAMEFIDGVELSDLIDGHRLAPELVVELLIQACEALSEAHAKGITHRDLKPENLMLVPISGGRIQTKVVDFGIAHALQHSEKLTQTGSVFGTAHYMAPEQASGGEISEATDIYALGCILYELLTGEEPFQAESPMGLLMKHVEADPPVLAQYFPESEDLDELSELVVQMMKKEASARPDDVLVVRDRLEEIQRTYNYPRLRVDTSAEGLSMFAKWQLDPVSPDMATPLRSEGRATNAPMTAPATGEHAGATGGQEASGVAVDSSQIGQTGDLQQSGQGLSADSQQQRTARADAHVTGLTDLSVAPPGRNLKILIPIVGILVLGGLIVGLLVMMMVFDDEDDVGASDESAVAEAGIQDDDEDAPEEPDGVAEEDGADESELSDEADELDEGDEVAEAGEDPDEDADESEEDEDETTGEVAEADEDADEPEPTRPTTTGTRPTQDPPSQPSEPAQPSQPSTPPAAQQEPEEEEEERIELDIFTVD